MFPSSDEAGGNEGNKCGGGRYAPIEPSGKNETDAAKSGSYPDPDNEQRAPPGISHGFRVPVLPTKSPALPHDQEGRRGSGHFSSARWPCSRRPTVMLPEDA